LRGRGHCLGFRGCWGEDLGSLGPERRKALALTDLREERDRERESERERERERREKGRER
jgi:hypothetical protein